VSPSFLERGEGAWVWDVDGNRYLDWLMALGPIILGYGDEHVNRAVIDQLGRGTVFSQMHELEVTVAERLVELIPCADMVRFGKTGSDATTAAVRVARAYTGRDLVLCSSYHGWHDWYIGTTTRSLGVPEGVAALSRAFAFGDIDALAELLDVHRGKVAAVIMEPIGASEPPSGYLAAVRALTAEHETLLVFDEIVTGFRLRIGGAQELYGVVPDLAAFGKAMANGLPLSAIVGRRDVMEVFDDIFYSGTFGGETLALAACNAVLDRMTTEPVIEHLWDVGGRLMDGLRALVTKHGLDEHVIVVGVGPRFFLQFPHADEREGRVRRTLVLQESVTRGVLYFGNHNPTYAHGDAEVALTLDVVGEAFEVLADSIAEGDTEARLVGEVVEPIFRRP
jgi:glutamate-1-semialdehyde aminotransferase